MPLGAQEIPPVSGIPPISEFKLTPLDIRVRDPLSHVTRNERRSLLAVSTLGVALVETGLIPVKIDALGIEFTQADQRSVLIIVALSAVYFLIAFTIYAASDFVAWRLALRNALAVEEVNRKQTAGSRKGYLHARMQRLPVLSYLVGPVSILRALFEFILPIAVGVYATVVLLNTAVR